MDEKKVCFITCVNDETVYNESLLYLQHLHLPDGMMAEFLSVQGATSMASGYDEAMQQSDAKYKVYLHQDVFLVNLDIIGFIVNIFQQHSEIGLLGFAGCKRIPDNGIWWQAGETYGVVAHSLEPESLQVTDYGEFAADFQLVQAIDGVFMATQYDIPWREDIFKAWHFYDISQSLEFKRQRYEVAVLRQQKPWCVHACGRKSLGDYDKWRCAFLQEYRKDIDH